ncbi:MAG: DUF447 domain-containing protein [Pseudomonadota bacterium]|nr:DUF447 domain-containing protein [Pseudomonadota bacterium]
MIIESIVSTISEKKKVNFAPFGIVREKKEIIISPYVPSTTLQNLISSKCAVINYIDDPKFYVNCIIGKKNFKKKRAELVDGFYLQETLSFDEVIVRSIIDDKIRPRFICKVVKSVFKKKYDGYNRAKSSIIEACILASRVRMLPPKKILDELEYLSIGVKKTAGIKEKKAWEKINSFIQRILNEKK